MLLLYTTFDDRERAKDVARDLLEEELIACANFTEVESIYRWEGDMVEDGEVLVLCKVAETDREAAKERLKEVHPYDVPCIVFYESVDALDDYASWVRGEL